MKELIRQLMCSVSQALGKCEVKAELEQIKANGWQYPDVTVELPSARDLIPRENIKYNSVLLSLTIKNIPGVVIADVADTNSEDPFFDIGHSVILIELPQPYCPYRYEDLQVGDLAVYKMGQQLISHRIVKIDTYEGKTRYRFRGDNTAREDPYLVFAEDIKYLIIGVIF